MPVTNMKLQFHQMLTPLQSCMTEFAEKTFDNYRLLLFNCRKVPLKVLEGGGQERLAQSASSEGRDSILFQQIF